MYPKPNGGNLKIDLSGLGRKNGYTRVTVTIGSNLAPDQFYVIVETQVSRVCFIIQTYPVKQAIKKFSSSVQYGIFVRPEAKANFIFHAVNARPRSVNSLPSADIFIIKDRAS